MPDRVAKYDNETQDNQAVIGVGRQPGASARPGLSEEGRTMETLVRRIAARIRGEGHVTQADARRRAMRWARRFGRPVTGAGIMREIERQGIIAHARIARRDAGWAELPLATRLIHYLIRRAGEQAEARGISTPTGWGWRDAQISDRDIQGRLWVVRSEYRYHYSHRFGDWWQGASYLCGHDDSGYWVTRCPRRLTSVAECLDYITPAAVSRAQDEGRWVGRQGDVWLVELRSGRDNLRALPYSHTYNAEIRILVHAEHAVLAVPGSVRAVRAYSAISVDTRGD